MTTKLGSGDVQFQGCVLDDDDATAILFCHHRPPHVPNKDKIQVYLTKSHVDREQDFSLLLDSRGEEDTVLVFRNRNTLAKFCSLVNALAELNDQRKELE